MSEFSGEAGTVYTEHHVGDDDPWVVWFEDLLILGTGSSELEALRDAERQSANIRDLVTSAISKLENANANPI